MLTVAGLCTVLLNLQEQLPPPRGAHHVIARGDGLALYVWRPDGLLQPVFLDEADMRKSPEQLTGEIVASIKSATEGARED